MLIVPEIVTDVPRRVTKPPPLPPTAMPGVPPLDPVSVPGSMSAVTPLPYFGPGVPPAPVLVPPAPPWPAPALPVGVVAHGVPSSLRTGMVEATALPLMVPPMTKLRAYSSTGPVLTLTTPVPPTLKSSPLRMSLVAGRTVDGAVDHHVRVSSQVEAADVDDGLVFRCAADVGLVRRGSRRMAWSGRRPRRSPRSPSRLIGS